MMLLRALLSPALEHENRVLHDRVAELVAQKRALEAVVRDQESVIRDLRAQTGEQGPVDVERLRQELARRTDALDEASRENERFMVMIADQNAEIARLREERRRGGGNR